jgi:uncharacterized protein
MRLLFLVAAAAAAAYALILLLVFLFQDRLLYFPTRELTATPERVGLAYENVRFRAADGVEVHAWFVEHAEPRGTVLFLHGNAGNLSHRLDSLLLFHELGLSTLILSYRGYGESEGRPSEAGVYRDAAAAFDHLVRERGVAPASVVVFGRSLGGAVAAEQAARERVGAVILESTFTSAPALAAELYPFLPVRLLARSRFDTLSRVAQIRSPLLVVHGPGDEIIPFHHGRAIWEAANEPKSFLELRGGHNDGFLISGRSYRDGLDGFLREHGM